MKFYFNTDYLEYKSKNGIVYSTYLGSLDSFIEVGSKITIQDPKVIEFKTRKQAIIFFRRVFRRYRQSRIKDLTRYKKDLENKSGSKLISKLSEKYPEFLS